jgi:hypothetical protein
MFFLEINICYNKYYLYFCYAVKRTEKISQISRSLTYLKPKVLKLYFLKVI